MVWRLGGWFGDRVDPDRLLAFATQVVPVAERDRRPPPALRFVLESQDVTPDAFGAPPLRRWIIHEARDP
jgi:hypothetical protein